jgi:hypothetical protein
MRLRKGPMIAALYPIVFLLLQLLRGPGGGLGLGWLVAAFHPLVAGGLAVRGHGLILGLRWFRPGTTRSLPGT